jgi:hypothetical protein
LDRDIAGKSANPTEKTWEPPEERADGHKDQPNDQDEFPDLLHRKRI